MSTHFNELAKTVLRSADAEADATSGENSFDIYVKHLANALRQATAEAYRDAVVVVAGAAVYPTSRYPTGFGQGWIKARDCAIRAIEQRGEEKANA